MSDLCHGEGVSPVVAEILMIILVITLAALLLFMIQFPSFDIRNVSVERPSFLEIRSFFHTDENSNELNYDSRVVLFHNGTETLQNSDLWAEFYRNGVQLSAVIETMNGEAFIKTHHYGVQKMSGLGCKGMTWTPGEKISIDFSDGTFHPGDEVRVDIFTRPSGALISSHTALA